MCTILNGCTMKLVSKEEFIALELDRYCYSRNTVELEDHHYKTSYYGEKGNLVGFYESFPNARGEMVSIYFRTQIL